MHWQAFKTRRSILKLIMKLLSTNITSSTIQIIYKQVTSYMSVTNCSLPPNSSRMPIYFVPFQNYKWKSANEDEPTDTTPSNIEVREKYSLVIVQHCRDIKTSDVVLLDVEDNMEHKYLLTNFRNNSLSAKADGYKVIAGTCVGKPFPKHIQIPMAQWKSPINLIVGYKITTVNNISHEQILLNEDGTVHCFTRTQFNEMKNNEE